MVEILLGMLAMVVVAIVMVRVAGIYHRWKEEMEREEEDDED